MLLWLNAPPQIDTRKHDTPDRLFPARANDRLSSRTSAICQAVPIAAIPDSSSCTTMRTNKSTHSLMLYLFFTLAYQNRNHLNDSGNNLQLNVARTSPDSSTSVCVGEVTAMSGHARST